MADLLEKMAKTYSWWNKQRQHSQAGFQSVSNKQTNKQTNKETNKQTNKQKNKKTKNKQLNKQTYSWWNRQRQHF